MAIDIIIKFQHAGDVENPRGFHMETPLGWETGSISAANIREGAMRNYKKATRAFGRISIHSRQDVGADMSLRR